MVLWLFFGGAALFFGAAAAPGLAAPAPSAFGGRPTGRLPALPMAPLSAAPLRFCAAAAAAAALAAAAVVLPPAFARPFFAAASAHLAGVPARPSAVAECSDASVQCTMPWVDHRTGIPSQRSSADPPPPADKKMAGAEAFLEASTVAALEGMMDAALTSLSEGARAGVPATTEADWRRLAALHLLREADYVEAPTRRDAGSQAVVAFATHAVR